MKIGYIRYLKNYSYEQQRKILHNNGCDEIIVHNSKSEKQSFDFLIKINPNDLLVVVSILDLANSISGLFKLVDFIITNSIQLYCVVEEIRLPRDKNVFIGLIKFEKKIAFERAINALLIAQKKGTGGRKKISDDIIKEINRLSVSEQSVSEICKILNISRSTYYKYNHLV